MEASVIDTAVETEENQGATLSSPEQPQRVLIFRTLVDKFLEGLVEAGSYQRFARCYRRFYKIQPEITRSIYDQFVSQLQTSIKEEIQEIIDEGNLETLLDSLDKLEKEAGGKTDLEWRPSGVPEEDLRNHLVPYLLQQRDYLRKILKDRVEENAKLAQAVLAGRQKIEEMQQEIERRKKAWQELSKVQRDLVLSIQEPI
ncbi:polyamine-modulated factor 1 [Bombina bombina]|uniref:polyamine-modulated factor 1 n=1 Tax=Bombina bombina TaxID=8345 RepID=UPI00235AD9BF|nr:polyamine-modulated factor 1 [Bombina bombina]